MIGLPRFAPKCLILIALLLSLPLSALAQAPSADAPAPIDPKVKDAVENYWHFARVAQYELANAEGQKVVAANADPEMVLRAFEQVAEERKDDIDNGLLRWQNVAPLRDTTTQLAKVVEEGRYARRSSPAFINEQIKRLTVNERAYGLAMSRLRMSGELAVPFLINILRDPGQRNMQPIVRRALRDLGRDGLNALVAATEMQEWDTLTVVIGVLGDLGYPDAAPYVARISTLPEAPATVKATATEALGRLGGGSAGAGDLFFAVGEKIYNEQSSIRSDRRFPMANIWYWERTGLARKQVPHEIYSEIMTMRECEYTLKLGGSRSDDALSLWLAANYRREAQLPEGATDTTKPEGYPNAHYWGVSAGTKYLNQALARAIKDRDAAVAFRAVRSLQEIVGQSNLFADQSNRPLIEAMQYPDRKVRFEAAFALAGALPQTRFEGQQRVVPLLAEALAQTGQLSVMVIMPQQNDTNKLVDDLKQAGINAAGATSPEGAITLAGTLPALDVILISDDLGNARVDELFNMANANARLAGAARLVMVKSSASIYEPLKVSDPLLSTTTATDAAGLKTAIEDARKKTGGLAMSSEDATSYATRAGELMIKIGISRGQVYDLSPAKTALLGGLNDARPAIVKLSGQAAALLNDAQTQSAILATASEEKTADEVKVSLFKSLATSAEFWGNKLNPAQVQTLEKTVADATNLDVRSAAAEARGALNLPADQAKSLVVKQSKT